MKEFEIKTFTDLHEIIEKYDARTVIYRGVKSVQYPLIPEIGRIVPPSSMRSRAANEKEILRLFKEQALLYLDFMPANDWEWLAIGQQHGLPTRSLAWMDWLPILNGYSQRVVDVRSMRLRRRR